MRTWIISLKFMVLMTVSTGFIYPGVMTTISQVLFYQKANGSLVRNKQGNIIGSELIAQGFKSEKYFWPRPSAIDYNPMSSGGSNLGPTSQDLVAKVKERKDRGFTREMLFTSGSGLDPHISIGAANDQVERIAKARGIGEGAILSVLKEHSSGRQFGILGEPRVNVLMLNLALDKSNVVH